MKIASFIRDGSVDCGLAVPGRGFKVFDRHRVIGSVEPEKRIFHLLGLAPEERIQIEIEMQEATVIPEEDVKLLPALPLCPLYIYNHANNPIVWKRQMGQDWEMTRVPSMRVRTFNCFSGDGAEVSVTPGASAYIGAELGVVIGRKAYRVPREEASAHIAGLVCLNDMFVYGAHDEFVDKSSPESEMLQVQGLHVLYKTADGNGGIGPWVVTAEELESASADRFAPQALERYAEKQLAPWVYDKVMRTIVNGQTFDESYTNAYLMGAEWMIAYLSRFMTLPTGSIVGLGSAGWDGIALPDLDQEEKSIEIAFELQDVGTFSARVVKPSGFEVDESPFVRSRRDMGLDPVPALVKRPGRSLWVLRGNNPASDPGVPVTGMNPILYPSTVLREGGEPIVLSPHMTRIYLSIQVCGIVGSQPLYRLGCNGQNISLHDCFEKICLLLSLRDNSLIEAINDPTPYESRAAYMLGFCGDGFFRLGGHSVTIETVQDLSAHTLSISLPGVGEVTSSLAGYRFGFSDMLAMISRTITLLPGDVISLGAAGVELEVSAEHRISVDDDGVLEANASWGASMRVAFDDQRDARFRESKR